MREPKRFKFTIVKSIIPDDDSITFMTCSSVALEENDKVYRLTQAEGNQIKHLCGEEPFVDVDIKLVGIYEPKDKYPEDHILHGVMTGPRPKIYETTEGWFTDFVLEGEFDLLLLKLISGIANL